MSNNVDACQAHPSTAAQSTVPVLLESSVPPSNPPEINPPDVDAVQETLPISATAPAVLLSQKLQYHQLMRTLQAWEGLQQGTNHKQMLHQHHSCLWQWTLQQQMPMTGARPSHKHQPEQTLMRP